MTTAAPPRGIRIGPEGLPKHTLGWRILQWSSDYLLQPDGPNAGEPWKYTDEQARLILWWYAIDERGRFLNSYGMLRRMKGWGKDPFGATICCVEFVGPCRFGGWRNGEPIGIPHNAAWVQTAAVSKDQTRNTMTLFPGMLSPRAIEEFSIDLGKEIIYAFHGQRRIEAVTSSPRTLEGGRSTFVLKNETHHWLKANEGHEMAAVIARNLAKSRDGSARALAISNAHNPGEDSDAEADWEAYRKIRDGLSAATGFLYDSLEAAETTLDDHESLADGLMAARGDSVWLDVERLCNEIENPKTQPATARRFYLNQIIAVEDKPFSLDRWRELRRSGYVVPDGALITAGFDGSLNRDWTACIGTEVATGYQWPIGIWEPRPSQDTGQVEIDVTEVMATIDDAFKRWSIWRFYGDPYRWREQLAALAGRYGDKVVVAWDTTKLRAMAIALQDYRAAINAGDISHDGDARFTAAIGNAHKHLQNFTDDQGERMWTIEKERSDSPFKIDPAIAGCLSNKARLDAIATGVLNQPARWSGILIPTGEEPQ